MNINSIVKALIIGDVVFMVLAFVCMGLGVLNISASDIALVGGVIMSPEVLVAINKMLEKKSTTATDNKTDEVK